MPRLFVSSRSQPEQSHRQSSRARLPTDRALQAAALAADDAPIAMPSPSPPPVPSPPTVRAVPNATNDEGLPLVLVPPLPQSLTRLMDSHDLDNPYLVAAFNVLIENNNNPMRVPDILQAVMHRGWTQVLHRHKERPEQLFGNALRSHQRRREMMNRPSLVFMIDAGSCWKHHQLDLSAASGRKKGKIWCFSVDAGYSCPYGRLGLDLAYVIRAQEPGNLDAIKPSDDKHIREATDDTSEEPTRKKRKLATTKADPITLALLEAAVRGGVASVHSVASSLEPPPYIPAATIQPKPHEMPYGTRSTRATALLQRQPVLPLEIVPRSANINSHKRNRSTTPPEVNLDALTAMSPEPTTGEDSTTEVEVEIEDDPKSAEETSCEAEEVDNAEPDFSQLFTTPMTFSLSPPTPLMPSMDMPVVKADVTNESDDDEDDFHVTMNQFSAPTSSPVKIEIETDMSTAAPSPMEDFESSDGSSSIPRTPTPSAEEIEPEERLALETDVKAMEGLLNLADEPLPPSVINVVPPTPIRTAKRSRSPSNNF
ncbi:hypothetical protein FRB99_003433 [Tulasnella sp. 403]|nr:hypothetical protein FRB99_003433 [Tulasnella sp. 403]